MSKDHEKDAKQDLKEAAVVAIQDPGDPAKFMHGRRTHCGLWSLPGGHLHPGESREHAAVREVKEETGIRLNPDDLVYLGSAEYEPQMEDYEKVLVHLYGLREPWQGKFPNVKDSDGEFDRIKFLNPRDHADLYNPNGENILIHHLDHKLVPEEHLTVDQGEEDPGDVGRRFYMIRIKDVSGVSGTGIVGIGIEFPDGKCVMQWQTDTSTVNNYDSMDDLIAVHGHGGHSKVVYVDDMVDQPEDEIEKSDYIKRHHRIFIATDADNLGASVERAALSNDVRKIKTMDRIIREGQQVIRDWCKRYKGVVYIDGGDDIGMFVDSRRFHEDDDKSLHISLERLRKEYEKTTGYTVTIGVGETPSKAAQAMVYGKLQGKNRIQDWSKEAEQKVGGHKETVEEKYRKEGLIKEELGKGVMSRKFPFNPKRDTTGAQQDAVSDWTHSTGQPNSVRDAIPEMPANAKRRALRSLVSKTQTRKNPTSGETEYLMHRGESPHADIGRFDALKNKSSWTPNINVADNFGSGAQDWEHEETGEQIHGKTYSAWIPEKHIHSVPNYFGPRAVSNNHRGEHEVIVNPHPLNLLSNEEQAKHRSALGDVYNSPLNTGRRLEHGLSLKDVRLNSPFKYTPGFGKSEHDQYVVVAVRHPILDNLYLHGRRMDDHRWTLPATQVLPGETQVEAALRVLSDEFGITPKVMNKVGSMDGGRTWLLVGIGKMKDSTVDLMEGAPYLDVKFIDPTGKNSYEVPRYKNTLLAYLKGINAPGADMNFMSRAGFDRRKALETSPDGQVVKSEPKYKWAHPSNSNLNSEYVQEKSFFDSWPKDLGISVPSAQEFSDAVQSGQIHTVPNNQITSKIVSFHNSKDEPNVSHIKNAMHQGASLPMPIAYHVDSPGAGHHGQYILFGGRSRVGAARELGHGVQMIVLPYPKKIVKAELEKGSLQAKMPFNPQKDISQPQHTAIQSWVRGAKQNARDFDIKPMTGNMRTRALSRIGSKTSVRKNPTSGENEYLLHRGMSPDEHQESVKDNKYHTWRRSSWSTNRDLAESFPKAKEPYEVGQRPPRHTVSAWVPESAIVHYPKMAGQPKAENPSKWSGQLYSGEDEVIADKQKPYQLASEQELLDASKHTLHQTPLSVRKNIIPDYFKTRLAEIRQKKAMGKAEMPATKEQLDPPNVLAPRNVTTENFDGAASEQASSVARMQDGEEARAKVPAVVKDLGKSRKP